MEGISRQELEEILAEGNMLSSMQPPKICVIGVGGAGCNSVKNLHSRKSNAEFTTIAINTDKRSLEQLEVDKKVLLGKGLTSGKGCGGNAQTGKEVADAAKEEIAELIKGQDIVFLTLGIGGGTGGGTGPEVAKIAKDSGAIVIAIAQTPFMAESHRFKGKNGQLKNLEKNVNSLIVLDNNKLLDIAPGLTLQEAFAVIDQSIYEIVRNLSDTFNQTFLLELTLSDFGIDTAVPAVESEKEQVSEVSSEFVVELVSS